MKTSPIRTTAMLSDGLPLCFVRFADFDGRRATIHDRDACVWFPEGTVRRYKLLAGEPTGPEFEHPHDPSYTGVVERAEADDLESLEPCWTRGERWVRTGVMPQREAVPA